MSSTMTNGRTRSISSTSSSSSRSYPGANAGIKKKFSCTYSGCGKFFSRSEHLYRHALNHKEGNHTCLRCRAHFRRRDLLDRHMSRHKEKDDEAGGEGLGILATRKRLWRDEAGKIVNARRPSCINQAGLDSNSLPVKTEEKTPSPRRRSSHTRGERKLKTPAHMSLNISAALPSPPMSSQARSVSPNTIIVDPRPNNNNNSMPVSSYLTSSPPPHHNNFHIHHQQEKLEDTIPLDPWLTSSAPLPLPLPSPPMSEASLGSSVHSHPSHSQSHEPSSSSLYEEPPHPTWSHHRSHHPHHQYISPTPHSHSHHHHWTPSQPFQTFMGSEGTGTPGVSSSFADDEEMGIFKPEMGLIDLNDWSSGQQQHWGIGGAAGGLNMSRCREERYDPSSTSNGGGQDVKREGWGYHHLNGGYGRGFGLGRC